MWPAPAKGGGRGGGGGRCRGPIAVRRRHHARRTRQGRAAGAGSHPGSTRLDETGRWALLKLVTGALRIGVSARLAKTAVAAIGDKDADEVELVWPSLTPPYADLFAWVEGRAARPASGDPAPFRPPMLSNAIEDADFAALDPADFSRRMEMGRHPRPGGRRTAPRRPPHRAAVSRAPARTSPQAFPISPPRSISTARSTASC